MEAEIVASDSVKIPPCPEMWAFVAYWPNSGGWSLSSEDGFKSSEAAEHCAKAWVDSGDISAYRIIKIPGDTNGATT